MKQRIFLLLILLFISIVTGLAFDFFTTPKSGKMVAEKVIYWYQNDSYCNMVSSHFTAKIRNFCPAKTNAELRLIGRYTFGLINTFKSKKELDEANYTLVDSKINETYSSGYFQGILARIRKYCIEEYAKYLPDDETGLLAGIVLGIKDNIRYDFYQEMIRGGAVHIAVASGFNLMLLYGFVSSGMFWLFGRKTVTWLLSFILYFYAMIAGLEPPIVRAWIMIVFLMFSQLLGRKLPGWWVLLVSGFLMLVWDIRLLSSVGFQLSMASSFALIVLLPFVKNFCEEKNLKPEFDFLEKLELVTTVLASAITLPIIYWHFGRVSLWGVLSNIFVLPLVPPLMVLGLLMLLAPAVFWIPTYVLSHTLVFLIHFFAN